LELSGDRDKTGSYSFIYANPSKVCGKPSHYYQTEYSRSLSKKYPFLEKVYWDRKGILGKSYFVSTVRINEKIIRKYIQSQEEENKGQTQLDF